MDLRTLGDIDGYERSRRGKHLPLEYRPVLRDGESWLGMHVCTYICGAMSHAAVAVGVFLIPVDHKVLFLRLSARASKAARGA